MLGIMAQFAALLIQDGKRAFSEIECRHDRTLDPLLILCRRLQTVDHKLDEMRLVAVQGCDFVQFAEFSVYADLRVAPFPHLFEQFLVMSLASLHQRRQQVAFTVLVVFNDQIHYLLVGVSDHGLACLRGVGCGCACIKQSQEIVYFGDGADCRTGIVSRGLLFYCDDRAQTGDGLHLRLLEDAHEMLCICRKGIHIPSLSFRIYGVERQGRLSAAAKSCHHDKLPAGDRQCRSLQVVGLRPYYFYIFLPHSSNGSLNGNRNGFVILSSAIEVSGPCPGITLMSPSRTISFSNIPFISAS